MKRLILAGAATATTLLLIVGPVTAAGERVAPTFDGSCELSGVATFDHPVTNAPESNGGTFRSHKGLANCVGDLSAGGRDLGSGTWPVRAHARATGTFSCASGSLTGRARIVVLGDDGRAIKVRGKRVRGWARIEMQHAVASGSISFLGRRDSRAEGVYNFTPSAAAIANCAAKGDKQLPMAVRFTTTGKFRTR